MINTEHLNPVDQLRIFYEQIDEFEELPHSFDDTLIDKLLDHLDFKADGIISFLSNKLEDAEFVDENSVAVTLTLRLVEKGIQVGEAVPVHVLENFVIRSRKFLQEERPFIVWSSLFKLYTTVRRTLFGGSLAEEKRLWRDVIDWVIAHVTDEHLSVFVRRDIETFLGSLEVEKDSLAHEVANEVLKLATSIAVPPLVCDSLYRILSMYSSLLPPESLRSLVSTVRNTNFVGHSTCCLAASILSSMPEEEYCCELVEKPWNSEIVRLNIVTLLLERVKRCPDLLERSVLDSGKVRLSHFLSLCEVRMQKKQFLDLLNRWCPALSVCRVSPNSDVLRLISLSTRLHCSLNEMLPYLKVILKRGLDEPRIVAHFLTEFGVDEVLNSEVLSSIIRSLISEGLKSDEWEERDSALEILLNIPKPKINIVREYLGVLSERAVSDPSCYVRAAAIKCMRHFGLYEQAGEVARKAVIEDPDPQPRLESLKVFHDRLLEVGSDFLKIVPSCIIDGDPDVRLECVCMCGELMETVKVDEKEGLMNLLSQFRNDNEIGFQVCKMLSVPCESEEDFTARLLTDMISALKIKENEDDTIDCY